MVADLAVVLAACTAPERGVLGGYGRAIRLWVPKTYATRRYS
jgi:hypothetical protein